MAGDRGLNVVHADHVRRIAEHVRRAIGGGRYVCSCASRELRTRIEGAFAHALGGAGRVVVVEAAGADPWAAVLARRPAHNGGVLVALHGLGGGAPGARSGYEALNLAREGIAASGVHLLLWLDDVGEFEAFAHAAPDLWTYRSEVVPFLSGADFPVAAPAGLPEEEPVDDAIHRLEAQLAEPGMAGEGRASLLLQLAGVELHAGRALAALRSTELAFAALGVRPEGPISAVPLHVIAHIRWGDALWLAGRRDEAAFQRRRLLGPTASAAEPLRGAVRGGVGRDEVLNGWLASGQGRIEGAIEAATDRSGQAPVLQDLVRLLVDAGRLADAERTLRRVPTAGVTGIEDGWAFEGRARVLAARGETVAALALLHVARGAFERGGHRSYAARVQADAVALAGRLGLDAEVAGIEAAADRADLTRAALHRVRRATYDGATASGAFGRDVEAAIGSEPSPDAALSRVEDALANVLVAPSALREAGLDVILRALHGIHLTRPDPLGLAGRLAWARGRALLARGPATEAAAREALLLARELAFPRHEAGALVALARACRRSAPPAQLRAWLSRARMWTEALGPPERLEAVEALARGLAAPP